MEYAKSDIMHAEVTVISRPTRGLGGVMNACWTNLLMGKMGIRES